jgi:flagellar biosynthetic protein FliR
MAPLNFQLDQIINSILWYILPFTRVASFVAVAPVFSTGTVPMKIRLATALVLTLAVAPALTPGQVVDPLSINTGIIILKQMMIGIALGLVMQLIFSAFVNGGQIVGMQMGLGFAQMMDPQTGVSVPVVSQFYNLMGILLFLSMNGHLVLIQILAESFSIIPVGNEGISSSGLESLLYFSSWMFSGALLMAIPAVLSLLMINVVMGVLTKASPQMNIFAVGFSITITAGFVVIMVTLSMVLPQMATLFSEGFMFMRQILEAG